MGVSTPYVPHDIVKPEKLAATAVGVLERELVVPTLFTRKGIEDFKGARDDTLNMIVPGLLPAHDYGWRNDRTDAIVVDEYKDRKISISFGGNAYSAVQLTDEQLEMDFQGWQLLLAVQNRAVAARLERGAVSHLTSADYAVKLGANEKNVMLDIVEARRVLNAFNVPKGNRILLVGSNWDAILQTDTQFNTAMIAGEADASSARREATIARTKGFEVVVSEDIDADDAYAFDGSAFAFLNAAPAVPSSIKEGGTAAYNGVALRWMRDYDPSYMIERSVVNSWYGFETVKDPIAYWDKDAGREVVTETEFLARGVKLSLGGSDSYLPGSAGSDAAKVRKALGLTGRAAATTHAVEVEVTP